MSTKQGIGRRRAGLGGIGSRLEEVTLNSVRGVLSDEMIRVACETTGQKHRNRIITPVVTVLHMVLAAIWPEDSFAASWQLLWGWYCSRYSGCIRRMPASGSVSKARKRLRPGVWEAIFRMVSEKGQKVADEVSRWRGLRVVLVDGTTVSMAGDKALFSVFGRAGGKYGRYKYPLARLVAMSLAETMMPIGYRMGSYFTSETALFVKLLQELKPGDLIVADRRYAGANLYARYAMSGVHYLTRMHQRLKVHGLKRLVTYGRNDFVAVVPVARQYRRNHPDLPCAVTVRFIRVKVNVRGKKTWLWLATSLVDHQLYPADELADLYAKRWRTETLFREFKINIGADVLRSRTVQGIAGEVAARLVAINVVRIIMLEAAGKHHVHPLRLSFTHALRTILAFAPALASEPMGKLKQVYSAMLCQIAQNVVSVRPLRTEPRACRRETKHYPTLRTTRSFWRLHHVA
ncbi:MAG: IS4 family transposase [Chloroflexi bacterium]|nr:MAG: IS4 family transposase [Chloroflexota bacterium]